MDRNLGTFLVSENPDGLIIRAHLHLEYATHLICWYAIICTHAGNHRFAPGDHYTIPFHGKLNERETNKPWGGRWSHSFCVLRSQFYAILADICSHYCTVVINNRARVLMRAKHAVIYKRHHVSHSFVACFWKAACNLFSAIAIRNWTKLWWWFLWQAVNSMGVQLVSKLNDYLLALVYRPPTDPLFPNCWQQYVYGNLFFVLFAY